MCSGELAAAAAAAAARLRWRREAGWDPRFLLLVLEVLLTMALAVVVASCGTVAVLLSAVGWAIGARGVRVVVVIVIGKVIKINA